MQEPYLRSALRGVARDILTGFAAFTKNGLALLGFAFVVLVTVVFLRTESVPALEGFSFDDLTRTQDTSSAALDRLVGVLSVPATKIGTLLGLNAEEAVVQEEFSIGPVGVARTELLASAPPMQETAAATTTGDSQAQKSIMRYITRKYRLSKDAVELVVSAAYETGREMNLDPTLLLAVMAIESGFNPFAESVMGAQGLMQVMSRIHRDKFEDFGGVQAALNPVANLKVGALILKDCIRRGGSIEAGLGLYVGAGMGDDRGYGAKVLREKARLVAASGVAPMRAVNANASAATSNRPIPSVTVAPEVEALLETLRAS